MKSVKCSTETCVAYDRLWLGGDGENDLYDRTRSKVPRPEDMNSEAKLEVTLRKISGACPTGSVLIQKSEGCDVISCKLRSRTR
jgi:hypothetical protein